MHPIFCFFVLETKSFPQIDMTRLSVFEAIRLFPSYRFKERKLKVFEDKHASDNSIENEWYIFILSENTNALETFLVYTNSDIVST